MKSKRQSISGFGQYPVILSDVYRPESLGELKKIVISNDRILAAGARKSYGDASLHAVSIDMSRLDNVLSFKDGVVKVQGGLLLGDLLEIIVPKGYFVHVTPGTKYVSIAGCVASNVHGKNHHSYGSFGKSVLSIDVVTADGKVVSCSRKKNADLFHATLGGMGLTGVIYSVELSLKKAGSFILLDQVKCSNLDLLFNALEKMDAEHEYTVAWLDSMKQKGIVMGGDHIDGVKLHNSKQIPIPFRFPNFVLNNFSIKLFNMFYYLFGRTKKCKIHYDGFFYPLDMLSKWNRMYGKRGFTQYQLVLPLAQSREGIKEILHVLSTEKCGSFLTVLKRFKKEEGLLSFPMEGYTLNLDFPVNARTKRVCNLLDVVVKSRGGRLYLAKDVFMDKEMLAGYTKLGEWKKIKRKYDPKHKFTSLQAKRLEL